MNGKPILSVECIFCGCRNEIPAASWGCVTRVEGQCFVCKRPIVWAADDKPAVQHKGDPVEEKSAALQDMTDLFVEAHDESVAVGKANFVLAALEKIYDSGYRKPPMPVAAPITDEQILEAMRPAMMSADGGYVFETAKDDVIEAGRALLDAAARVEPDNSALLGLLLSGISIDENGFYHLSGINPENFKRAIKASGATLAENIPGHKSPVAVVIDIESAAKKIAERMDYPWECMPEQGRNSMRENAKAIVDAAMLNGVKP